MQERILRYMRENNMTEPGDTVIVALSGGADSVCLFHILLEVRDRLGIRLEAVHVNHGLRESAGRDEAFVRRLCERTDVPLTVFSIDVRKRAETDGSGIEETARRMRYSCFETLIREHVKIALGQHMRDQAETLLLQLFRGSGLKGLAGMPPVHGYRIRPLLAEDPSAIRRYLTERGLHWVEDETNGELIYRRNRLRHEILPLLAREFNPDIVGTLSATATRLREDEEALKQAADGLYLRAVSSEGLSVSVLLASLPALRKRCIHRYLAEHIGAKNITSAHLRAVEELLMRQSGRRVCLPGGAGLVREYDRLRIVPGARDGKMPVRWEIPTLPYHVRIDSFRVDLTFSFVENMEIVNFSEKLYTKYFDCDTIKNTLTIRTRQPGDFLTMAGGRKKLKEYLIDEKIAASERDSVLLLADGSHILWVIGARMSDGCKLSERTGRVLRVDCSFF